MSTKPKAKPKTNKSRFTEGLDECQREAVLHNEGPMLILAGAGSGKTRVLTHRIARMIQEKVAQPEEILAVTFTNKAAREMNERVADLVGKDAAAKMTISTFHSFGVKVLREDGAAAGIGKNFTIIDDNDRTSTMKSILRSTGRAKTDGDHSEFLQRISLAKNASLSPSEFAATSPDDRRTARVYDAYKKILVKQQSVDFDDLLLLPLEIFSRHPEILAKYRKRYRFISIDEFQDTNAVQMKLARLLSEPLNNLTVVGDDDQSIYSWRGAQVDNILSYPSLFDRCKTVVLGYNYRSTKQIVEGAQGVIVKNHKRRAKQINAAAGDGNPIETYKAADELDEAKWVVATIKRLEKDSGFAYTDQAILFRTNAQMRRFEEELRIDKIPYKVQGAMSFFDRKEVKDVLAYVRFFANTNDEISLERVLKVPNKNISPASIEKLEALAGFRRMSLWEAFEHHADAEGITSSQAENIEKLRVFYRKYKAGFDRGELSSTLRAILDETGYIEAVKRAYNNEPSLEMRLEIIEEIVHGLELFEKRSKTRELSSYVQEISLSANEESENADARQRGVTLITMHKSKGLEWPVVFIPDLDDKTLPSARALAEGGLEEERRLFYVAMTRARRRLFLSWPGSREVRKQMIETQPCRFVYNIPEECLDGKIGEKQDAEREVFVDNFFADMQKMFSTGGKPAHKTPRKDLSEYPYDADLSDDE